MKIFKPSPGVFIEVNAKLLYASILGCVSYAIWPTSLKWYGFGLLSVFAGLAAFALTMNAAKLARKIYVFERDQKEFLAEGNQVKSSTLASEAFMTEKGVIKDAK